MKILRKAEFTIKLSEDEMSLLVNLLSIVIDENELKTFGLSKEDVENAINLFNNLNDVLCL